MAGQSQGQIMAVYKAYKYRLLPTEAQKAKLASDFGCCRLVYNLALETKITAWKSAQKNLSAFELMRQLTELKREECPWLYECSSRSLISAISNLDKAYKSFYNGGGFPKFKPKSGKQSIHFRVECRVDGNMVFLSKIGMVKFILHRPMCEGELRCVTVSKTVTDKYFVSILIKQNAELPSKAPILNDTCIGIDLGIKTFAYLSNGLEIQNPRFLKNNLDRIKIEQRKLSRRLKRGLKLEEQSKGWHKQKMVLSKLHEKVANQRSDFLHKISTSIIKMYDTVCVENLNIAGMIRNRSLSQSISDASWSEFIRMLEYKAGWYGKNIVTISRFYPSSKTCSSCGDVLENLKISDRSWVCKGCGAIHDRDYNAAKNIKRIGLEAEPSTVNVSQKTERIGCEKYAATWPIGLSHIKSTFPC